ncbi:type II toxin-antitoxin system RelE/ParE family toxin [Allokutzneria sp. NRRL B-24872]|uniref:type II toxin-antitoxin system RelE family toxin n=1 Tax=Allokutzneria sp. NRRL B-24872 TaxID=1137961 RepID=UPI000A3669FD|nr:type II toxin-antitoxin system RelE/ParE family toxin [Allokutzneria sp. NRRL B-24872]
MARVLLTTEAKEDLRDLDGSARKIVLKVLKKLETDPESRGAPLGSRPGSNLVTFRKLVVGDRDYRVVYRVETDGTVVVVWVIGKRTDGECYDLAVSRIRLHSDDPELLGSLVGLLDRAWGQRERTTRP